ncbi:asparagine--tRNA ligase [Ruminiclostridium herbifermentans]|uniref:Asparagine--tRNA ligase n=1 Tax=Ruminiclostridium herbifermentans TaxID=2488810 RepID=A0A4U7JLN0_9FIRM|nr:asparagine--tRNA ligase [Ruminiclostridium herbifermentans]QNU66091.1 asparagine--tRNA ligase [Ruminiclostridium herbifermentans]
MYINDLYGDQKASIGKEVKLNGWIRNHRKQKKMGFIDFFDGSCFKSIQIVYEDTLANFDEIQSIHIGAAISIEGTVVVSAVNADNIEINASNIILVGDAPEDYPLQPKKHSIEFLREIAYLRPRTRVFQAVFRIRSLASMAIHEYFHNKGYVYVHTPIITGNDAEGAGNTFTVTCLENNNYEEDFFGKKASLAVTGQLEGETFAMAFGKIYTFGPTFRAENSNTKTHAAEFWMIEPEIAFCDLNQLMDIEEDFLKSIVSYILDKAKDELEFLQGFTKIDLFKRLEKLKESKIARVTHKEAIEILKKAPNQFVFTPEFGKDLAREHEKYLTEEYFNGPVFVYNWPKDIKAFYMYQNDDNETVAAVDLLVPDAGELMGGSQREVRYDLLRDKMEKLGINTEEMYWYLNLRKFGSCDHAGFGMGFERFLIYVTGVDNIRDVIPYPRTPGYCEF